MPNPFLQHKLFDLAAPRHLGRGQAKNSAGATHTIVWVDGVIRINGIAVESVPLQPQFLDFAYDTADRPQICFQGATASVVRYWDVNSSAYVVVGLGATAVQPIICNERELAGLNTIVAYLKGNIPHYRLLSDGYLIEYQWASAQYAGIKALGYCAQANSINLLLG